MPLLEDTSYPPVDFDSPFFAEHAHEAHEAHYDHEPEERDPRMILKRTPQAARRRARFQQYVKVAVAAASALCLAALVKAAVARGNNGVDEAPRKAAATSMLAPTMPASPPVTPAPASPPVTPAPASSPHMPPTDDVPPPASAAPVPEPVAPALEATPSAAASAGASSQVAAPSPSAEPPAQPSATPDPQPAQPAGDTAAATEPDPKAAAKEKHVSQLALERGKLSDSIAAGERSVALDPTDAEAWLILGAAYQAKGDAAKARQAFHACLVQGKRGPKAECAQFPH